MKIALGADHKGFQLKSKIMPLLKKRGATVIDFGAFSESSVDYSDFALKVSEEVAAGRADKGILICWTGNGMTIAANKVKGIRAALALTSEMAQLARSHNNANVLTLSGKYTKTAELENILKKFISTEFEGGRHERRLGKIKKYEDENKC